MILLLMANQLPLSFAIAQQSRNTGCNSKVREDYNYDVMVSTDDVTMVKPYNQTGHTIALKLNLKPEHLASRKKTKPQHLL